MSISFGLRVLAAAGAGLALSPSVHAQQFIGSSGAACGMPTVGGEITIAASTSVIVGDTVIVAVASGSNAVTTISVVDARNNIYRPFGVERADVRRFAVAHFIARVDTAIAAGDLLRVRVGHPSPAQEICFRASVFRGVVTSADALDTQAVDEDTGVSLNLTANNGSFAGMLNFASFALSGDPGTLTAAAGDVALARVCSAGNALCLASAFDFSTGSGAQNVALGSSNAVPWAGTLSTIYTSTSLSIFKNSFE